jgi:hypothetical protein
MAELMVLHNANDDAVGEPATMKRPGRKSDSRIPFADCTISFAIDTSGSTLGRVLSLEQQATLDISSKLSSAARAAAKVLPWNSSTDHPTKLSELTDLESYGGTEPVCLLNNSSSRQALQTSTMWFLLTDGEIYGPAIQRFAHQLAAHRMHGTACVSIIFAPTRKAPADCNISVGVAVFAAVPDCLFLYYDTISDALYLLQCSGRFTQILEEIDQAQPILNESTSWADLPQVTFEDLASVSIPAPKVLGENQVALPDGLVLDLQDLWSGRVTDEEIIDRIFRNDDNLKSIMLTAQTRGQVKLFQAWLKPFLDDTSSPLKEPVDLGDQAMQSARAILEEMQTNVSPERLKVLQKNLNEGNARSDSHHLQVSEATSKMHSRRRSSEAAMARSSQSHTRARSISSVAAGINDMHIDQPKPVRKHTYMKGSMRTPDFKRPKSPAQMFQGRCSQCRTENAMLVLLLRTSPSKSRTRGFPAPNSGTGLAYPLAMGNFPETDIISSSICCDVCSYDLAQSGKTPGQEELLCVLPLVTCAINEQAYKKQLKLALENRFHEGDLLQLLLAILVNTFERLPNSNNYDLLRRAIKWSCQDLLLNTLCADSSFQTVSAGSSQRKVNTLLNTISKHFENIYQANGQDIFPYPLQGFATMVIALRHSNVTPKLPYGIKNIVWQRLLYQVTQNYHEYLQLHGPLLTRIKMTEILLEVTEGIDNQKIRKTSLRGLRDIGRALFGDRGKVPNAKEATEFNSLASTKLLTPADVVTFRSLSEIFEWIEAKTSHALCVFLNYLARSEGKYAAAWERFNGLRENGELTKVFFDPSDVSSKMVGELITSLPPMVETD